MLVSVVALASASLLAPPAVVWYGPATVTFHVQVAGNPYDPAVNDLKVRFMPEKGPSTERLAYVDFDGTIKATLVSQNPGRYRAVLMRNGKDLLEECMEGIFDLGQKLPNGYLRVDSVHKNRFQWDSGKPYYPVGFNLGWQSEGLLPLTDQISKMAGNGINWTRIWSSNWDNKNPWWPNDDPNAQKNELWQKSLVKWNDVVNACDQVGLPFQMVLFNHGSFSSTVNPNWQDHPWNEAKGGFLKNAADFFTDDEAKRRTRMWLRYAVARYGHSPNLMAWELFNEVEWVDARYADRWNDIAFWHKEMAEFLRSIDPYKHLVTTSSFMEEKGLWEAMDYYQPHTYPSNVLMSIAGFETPTEKPSFFGEFGPPGNLSSDEVSRAIRDGIYGAMLTNQAGAAQYWYWDLVEKNDLYSIFKTAASIRDESGIAEYPTARPMRPQVTTPGTATLAFGPGSGWGKTGVTRLNLPVDVVPEKVGKLSAYLQSVSGNNKDLFPEPLEFRFTATSPGVFRLKLSQAAKAGAHLKVFLNGKEAADRSWPAAEKETPINDVLQVPFSAGENVIRLENTGADWVQMQSFEFTNLGAQAEAMALGASDWLMARIQAAPGVTGPQVTLKGISIADGEYALTVYDLIKGGRTEAIMNVKDFTLSDFRLPADDVMLLFKRKL